MQQLHGMRVKVAAKEEEITGGAVVGGEGTEREIGVGMSEVSVELQTQDKADLATGLARVVVTTALQDEIPVTVVVLNEGVAVAVGVGVKGEV